MSDSLRRLAAQIVGIRRDVLQLQTAPRAGQTSIEHGGAITVVDPETGTVTARLGTQADGTYGAVTLDGPIPPNPTAPILDVAPGLVAVTWDGTHADGAATPLDFYAVEVYVAAGPFAFIEEGTLSGSLVGSDGDRITIALAPGVWHVGLVTVSQAMKRSRLSGLAIATVSALPSDEDIALAGGRVTISDDEPEVADAEGKPDSALWQQVVDDVLVGAWRLDAAVPEWRPIEVAPGTPYMPKIDLGSATVGLLTGARLAADAIDGKTITGATFRTGPSVGPVIGGQGIILNSSGLSAFNASGIRTVNVNSATGGAEFVGGFKTAATGARMELLHQSGSGALRVFDGAGVEVGAITLRNGALAYFAGAGENPSGTHAFRGRLITSTLTAVSGAYVSDMRIDALAGDNFRVDAIRRSASGIECLNFWCGPAEGFNVAINKPFTLRASLNTNDNASSPRRRWNPANDQWERTTNNGSTWMPDIATESWVGPVELATSTEVLAGTDAARAVTPAALASWRDSHFYLAKKTTSQTGISFTPVQITGLTLSAPRAGRARIQISCTSKSSASDDLVAYEIRVNGAKIKRGTQLANSGGTSRGHLLEMTAITTLAAGGAITVWVERPIGSGAVEIDASPADPCTLTLEYV